MKKLLLLFLLTPIALAEVTVTEPSDLTPLQDQLNNHEIRITNEESASATLDSRVTATENENASQDTSINQNASDIGVNVLDIDDLQQRVEALEGQQASSTGTPDGYVYVRIDRTTETQTHDTGNAVLDNLSALDRLSEVTWQGTLGQSLTGGGQLVWRKGDGTELVIHDCPTGNVGELGCLPYDPRVSLDGTKVSYTLYEGEWVEAKYPEMNPRLNPTKSTIHIADLTTDPVSVTSWASQSGVYDTAPNWLPGGRIAFTSTRANIYPGPIDGFSPEGVAFQLWVADADGTNAVNWSPHAMRDVLHPVLHPTMGLFYSRWWINKERVDGGTADNFWHIETVTDGGGNPKAILKAHKSFDGIRTLTALHFLGVRSNGDVCANVYYRGNNLGSGRVRCWTIDPLAMEGPFPFKKHANEYLALLGHSGDTDTGTFGRTRDPMGLPNNDMVFAWGQGFCHRHNEGNMEARVGQKGCDFGIYTQASENIPESDVSARTLVVDSPEWHEIMPQPVMPYADIYGQEPVLPQMATTGDGTCVLGSASMKMQIDPEHGWRGPDDPSWCKEQGCSLQGVDKSSLMASIKFWRVVEWNGSSPSYSDFDNLHNSDR